MKELAEMPVFEEDQAILRWKKRKTVAPPHSGVPHLLHHTTPTPNAPANNQPANNQPPATPHSGIPHLFHHTTPPPNAPANNQPQQTTASQGKKNRPKKAFGAPRASGAFGAIFFE